MLFEYLDPISSLSYSLRMGTVRPAKVRIVVLNTVPYDSAPAVQAGRGQRLDRAFKTVKGICMTSLNDIEGFIVSVVTSSAGSHRAWSSFSGLTTVVSIT